MSVYIITIKRLIMHFTKEQAQDILVSRAKNLMTLDHIGSIITSKVSRVSDVLTNEKTGSRYHIVNFPLLSTYYANKAKALMAEGKFDDAVNCTVTYNIYLDDRDGNPKANVFVPTKGQTLNCEVGKFPNENGDTVITIDTLIPLKKKELATFDFGFETVEEEADIDSVLGKK